MFVKLGSKNVNFALVQDYAEVTTERGRAVDVVFNNGDARRYSCSELDTHYIGSHIIPAPDGYFCVELDDDGAVVKSPIVAFRYLGPADQFDLEPITIGFPGSGGILRPDGAVIVPQLAEYPSLDAFLADRRAMREKR